MQLIFELSGEHETLPTAEVLASLEAEQIKFNVIEQSDRLLLVSLDKINIQRLKNRLALTFLIDEKLAECKPKNEEKLIDEAKNLDIGNGSYCVRAKRINKHFQNISTMILERKFGMHFKENKVMLKNPDIEVRILLSNKCYIGIKKVEIDRGIYEKRKVQNRPFFSPISLHPRLARALVNLSRVKKGQTLLDPFCGTGGILIEASLIGVKVIGCDIQEKMVKGSKENLNHFKISNYQIQCLDISEVRNQVNKVDAIATDLPYGRASFLHGNIEDICFKAFETFNEILNENSFVAVVLHDKNLIEIGKKFLNFEEMYKIRVHGSLNRYFCVYKKMKK